MDRRAFIATLVGGLMAAPRTLLAQPRSTVARIGFLAAGSTSARVQQPFLQGMRELGRVEGQDFAVDWRFAEGKYERLPDLVAELVRLKVDVIVAVTTLCVQAVRQATTT